jgi:hypothetical protein
MMNFQKESKHSCRENEGQLRGIEVVLATPQLVALLPFPPPCFAHILQLNDNVRELRRSFFDLCNTPNV